MAQKFLSDFFPTKKQGHILHPSKRRKLDLTPGISTTDTRTQCASESSTEKIVNEDFKQENFARVVCEKANQPVVPTAKPVLKSTRTRGAKKEKPTGISRQVTIKHALSCGSGLAMSSNKDSPSQQTKLSQDLSEEVTYCWDDHDEPKTPRKRTRPLDTVDFPVSAETKPHRLTSLRSRCKKALEAEDNTPAKGKTEEQELAKEKQRKHALAGCRKYRESIEKVSGQVSSDTGGGEERTMCREDNLSSGNKQENKDLSVQECLKQFVEMNAAPISPLPNTPDMVRKMLSKSPQSIMSTKLEAANNKCKELSEASKSPPIQQEQTSSRRKDAVVAPDILRARLAKCGKLEMLKSKLAEMNSTLKAVRKIEAERHKLEAEDKPGVTDDGGKAATAAANFHPIAEPKAVPAHERFEYLAQEGPPALVLPGKFQRLLAMFQSTDTVVSMLFNRQETITFTKLQTAVQSMTRKNFHEKTLGQIKTVYPSAYKYQQEKDVPCFGKKSSGYQLTVEPNLKECTVNEDGRPTFPASALLKRKQFFKNNLFHIAVRHHNNFLAKLNPPVHVAASELTRWHPHFPLDSVPDIEPAALPKPPVKCYQTAKDVLESTSGHLPSRVQHALETVATGSNASGNSSTKSEQSSSTRPCDDVAYKGIPLALLEKIRAKEAARLKAVLTRDPAEDRKTNMMRRLPNMIRSLSTCFVTEKKPSLLLPIVVEKLAASYATSISQSDVEAHLKLLRELVPHWLQILEISTGKYVKIDKNVDIMSLISKIENIVKNRQ